MNRFNRYLAAGMAALLMLASAPLLHAESSTVDVIVSLDVPDDASASEFANAYAERLTERFPEAELGYIYDTLLCGFHLSIPESMIGMIENLDHVESVAVCGTYEALAAVSTSEAIATSAELIGYTAEIGAELSGDGIKVAVLDNGFDVTHPAFSGRGITETLDLNAVNEAKPTKRLSVMRHVSSAQEFYVNAKIPFRFDYAGTDLDVSADTNHGTHVAGIIGAVPTKTSVMQGIAPGCQLLLMKVFDDYGYTSDQVLIAALEDALKLDADVVNLSLGRYSGSATTSQVIGMDQILDKMEAAGCIVICAVGNDYISTERSELAAQTMLPPTDYTDFGTVSAPAASNYAFSVTSVDNGYNFIQYIRHNATNSKIRYSDTNQEFKVIEDNYTEHFDEQTLEYVVVPGIGEEADYSNIDVNGKLALIERGTTTFVEKVNIAASHGAVGTIIYNNVDEGTLGLELTGATIPAISISKADGKKLASASNRQLSFDTDYTLLEESSTAGKISEFASRGATPSLTIKPDIATVGGQVLSTINNGKYGASSGTSMAAPQLTGICALLLEKLYDDGHITTEDLSLTVRTALMNTAVPILQKNDVECSPRTQGAGLANIAAALSRELEITYVPNGMPKAELYDLIGDHIYIDVQLKNLTAEPLSLTLGATLATDGYTKLEIDGVKHYFNTLEAIADTTSRIVTDGKSNLNRNSEDYSPLAMTLAPNESLIVPLVIEFDETYHDAIAEIYTNGHFVDGFIYCETAAAVYSMPYMGYMGDWAAAPILDDSYYTDELTLFGGTAFMTTASGSAIILETPDPAADIAFSPNADGVGDALIFGAIYLRNGRDGKMTVKDADGNILCGSSIGYVTKSYGFGNSISFPISWDGSDGIKPRYHFPDGVYTMNIEYTLDYRNSLSQTYEYKIRIDTQKPTLTDIRYDGKTLTVTADDISEIKTILICENESKDAFSAMVTDSTSATFDLSGYTGDTLYYEIIDHALNTLVGKITLSELAA